MPVNVKALDWLEDEPNWWTAQPDSMFRGYEVRITDTGKVRARRGNDPWFDFNGTLDQAKDHWQKDFAKHILSALT